MDDPLRYYGVISLFAFASASIWFYAYQVGLRKRRFSLRPLFALIVVVAIAIKAAIVVLWVHSVFLFDP